MLTCLIEETRAIPVRALPFLTGGTFLPKHLAALFYDPEAHANALYPTPPTSYAVSEGWAAALPPTKWNLIRIALQTLEVNASDLLVQIRALPAAVFVGCDEFKSFYDFLAARSAVAESMGFQPAPAGEWGWDERALVTPEQHALIWEGFDLEQPAIDLQARAELLAQEMRQRDGVWPTRNAVARELAKERSRNESTILRRIKKTWL